jgi:hypothetical protein
MMRTRRDEIGKAKGVKLLVGLVVLGAALAPFLGAGRSNGPDAGLATAGPKAATAQTLKPAATPGTAPAARAAAPAPTPGAPRPPASLPGPASVMVPGAAEAASPEIGLPEIEDTLLQEREEYFYASLGRRDPFGSLLKGQFTKDGKADLPDVGNLRLVGVMWGEKDRYALCEDSRGNGYILREGDPVVGGTVGRITQESLTVVQNFFGEVQTITIHLDTQGGDPNEK